MTLNVSPKTKSQEILDGFKSRELGMELELLSKQPQSPGCKCSSNGTLIFERAAVDLLNLKDPEVKNYLMKKVIEEARGKT